MTEVTIGEHALKKHSGLVQIAAGALESLPGDGCVMIGDAATTGPPGAWATGS